MKWFTTCTDPTLDYVMYNSEAAWLHDIDWDELEKEMMNQLFKHE